MTEKEHIFINGEWKTGSGPYFTSSNPATGDILWKGREASSSDVNKAIESAREAFQSWSMRSLEERIHFLVEFANSLRLSQHHLGETIAKETGKPLWDSLNEVEAMINKIKISIIAFEQRCPVITRDQAHARLITRHRPHGVVGVFGPYNFPGHLPNGHIIPALLAGNTVVFKPSEWTPLVAEETLRLWQKAKLPSGVINLVQGGRETGNSLAHHQNIDGIFFTGSYATGLAFSQLFASHPSKILALEMGGNNPLVVGNIHDLEAAAYMIVQSAFLSSGQRCTCARRLILLNNQTGDKLLETLIEMINRLLIGSYDQKPEPFMGPLISEIHGQQILEAEEYLQSKGGNSLLKMRHLKKGTGFISPGLMDVTAIQDRPDKEIFGPFLQVIRVNDLKEAIREGNNTTFGLSAGLLSDDEKEFNDFFHQIRAGIVNWNTPLTGSSSSAPFGGIKCSGNHRPSAYYAADYCSYPVTTMESPELKLPTIFSPGIEKLPRF